MQALFLFFLRKIEKLRKKPGNKRVRGVKKILNKIEKPNFTCKKYHKLGYDIERMFEQKIRMEKKRTYCPLFTTIGINAEAQDSAS